MIAAKMNGYLATRGQWKILKEELGIDDSPKSFELPGMVAADLINELQYNADKRVLKRRVLEYKLKPTAFTTGSKIEKIRQATADGKPIVISTIVVRNRTFHDRKGTIHNRVEKVVASANGTIEQFSDRKSVV